MTYYEFLKHKRLNLCASMTVWIYISLSLFLIVTFLILIEKIGCSQWGTLIIFLSIYKPLVSK